MTALFEKEVVNAKTRPKITDPAGSDLFQNVWSGTVDKETANAFFVQADKDRLGSTKEQHSAAYTYLALAFKLIDTPAITVDAAGTTVTATQMFHFAGHTFREIGQLNRAADAYWRAGVTSSGGPNPDDFGIRSLSRAKTCYAEIGETNRSDEVHFLEWEARRLNAGRFTPFLSFWKVTSRYGTSVRAWFVSIVIFLGVFAGLYELFHELGWLCDLQPWTPILTAFYYSVVTTATVGYGEILPCHWIAQATVTVNILVSYVLLAIGATILGRKVLGR